MAGLVLQASGDGLEQQVSGWGHSQGWFGGNACQVLENPTLCSPVVA